MIPTLAEGGYESKIGGLLTLQVEAKLRTQQRAPLDEGRLDISMSMQNELGMRVVDPNMQRIFIHFAQEPDKEQVTELEAMGLTLYLDSWIPPVGVHPTGLS